MKKHLLHLVPAIWILLSSQTGFSRDSLALIPQPRHLEIHNGPAVRPEFPRQLEIRLDAPATWDEEQYSLQISSEGIRIQARTRQGVTWAMRTLEQLRREDGCFPQVNIVDRPEFRIRAFMYDTGRNFVDIAILKYYIDLASAYKLNVFHWHLTDKPAWRIECRCHPELNDARFQRPGRNPGAYYTYDQIREVIDYAKERGMMTIPEIDMPGHSDFFTDTYGFTMDSPEGMRILEDCFREFYEEIPAAVCPYIHIGSDEVHIDDPQGFMQWAQRIARSDGRRTIVWDPGLPADGESIRQIWREGASQEEIVTPGTAYVDSSMGYLNYYDPLILPYKIFCHTPCYTGKGSDEALGGILCMWNDVRTGDPARIHLQNGMAGGLLAFAERFWNGGQTSTENPGTLMQPPGTETMERFLAFQQKMSRHKNHFLAEEMEYWQPVQPTAWEITLTSPQDTVHTTAYGDVLDLDALCKKHRVKGLPVHCRVLRTVTMPQDTSIRFKTGFEAPARSNRISDGIAEAGCWENSGLVLVNGTPVPPPVWNEPGKYRFHFNTWGRPEEELPFTDEQLYWMRHPVDVTLKRGSNTVELRLVKSFEGQRFHLAFVPVQP